MNKKELKEKCEYLEKTLHQVNAVCKLYENKIIELMGKEDASKYIKMVAQELFRTEIINMPESDFKDFLIENFEEITGTKYE